MFFLVELSLSAWIFASLPSFFLLHDSPVIHHHVHTLFCLSATCGRAKWSYSSSKNPKICGFYPFFALFFPLKKPKSSQVLRKPPHCSHMCTTHVCMIGNASGSLSTHQNTKKHAFVFYLFPFPCDGVLSKPHTTLHVYATMCPTHMHTRAAPDHAHLHARHHLQKIKIRLTAFGRLLSDFIFSCFASCAMLHVACVHVTVRHISYECTHTLQYISMFNLYMSVR